MGKAKYYTLIAMLMFCSSQAFSQATKYPYFELLSGDVEWVGIGSAKRKAVKNEPLRQTARIKLKDKAFAVLVLSENSRVNIFSDTDLEVPEIDYESGRVDRFVLHHGKFRYTQSLGGRRQIETPIFKEQVANGDFVFWYYPETPKVEVMVIEGELRFRGLENENSVNLSKSQKAAFVGQIENAAIVYDEMLRGRRIARGELSKVQNVDSKELSPYLRKDEEARIKASQVKPVIVKKEDEICEKPFAKLNECYWRRRGGLCLRDRCNANGVWAERTELRGRADTCLKQERIAPCDY